MELAVLFADPTVAAIVVGALALILFGAAWHKLSEPNAFLSALAGYRLLPEAMLGVGARALPLVEIALGLGALLPATRTPALTAIAGLFLLYAAAMALNLLRGRGYIDCGCGGAAHTLSWGLVVRNAVLAALAVSGSGPTVERTFDWLDAVTLVFGALAFYVAYLAVDELLRQASRMARTEQTRQQASATS